MPLFEDKKGNIKSASPLADRIRPESLEDFAGQTALIGKGKMLRSAIEKDEIPSMIFWGPPGCGKTTLAKIIANMTNSVFIEFSATTGGVKEVRAIIAEADERLRKKDIKTIFFIDEIHRLSRNIEEYLYSGMEEFCIDIMIGEGPKARSVKIPLKHFTLVGATTRIGLLTSPLRNRFGIMHRLDYYNTEELRAIIVRAAGLLHIEINKEGAEEIAKRARGTPRVANRLLRRIRDYAQVKGKGVIDIEIAKLALDRMDVDEEGLDEMDKKILDVIITKFAGGPVGLKSLSIAVGEESDTIEEVYESFLVRKGFIKKTAQGRTATILAYKHLGMNISDVEGKGPHLF